MKKYWRYFHLSLIRTFTYRGQLLIFTLASLLTIVPIMAVWLGFSGSTAGGFTRSELIYYYLIGLFLQRLVYSSLINYYVQEIVADGSIVGLFLTKPVSFFWALFGLEMGWLAVSMVVGGAITGLFWLLVGGGAALQIMWPVLILAILATILAITLTYCTSLLLGLFSLWTVHISSFVSLYWIALFMLGGITLPLSFFPGPLQNLVTYSPFRFIFSFPLEIMLGKVDFHQTVSGFLVGLFWVVISVFGYRLLWKAGNKAYTGYGQ